MKDEGDSKTVPTVIHFLDWLLRRIIGISVAFGIIGILWRWMELEVYGRPNPNGIDTIIGFVFAVSLTENYFYHSKIKRMEADR